MNGNSGERKVVCMFEYDLALVNEYKIVTILFYCDDLNAILYVV